MTKIIDQLNYSESHTGNLLYCDSIMSVSKDRAFESLFLENYASFILTTECKEELTLQGALSGHNQGREICLSSYVCSEFHFQ